jgi:hypothetical protein
VCIAAIQTDIFWLFPCGDKARGCGRKKETLAALALEANIAIKWSSLKAGRGAASWHGGALLNNRRWT